MRRGGRRQTSTLQLKRLVLKNGGTSGVAKGGHGRAFAQPSQFLAQPSQTFAQPSQVA